MLTRLVTGVLALLLALPAGILVFAGGALLDPALRDAFGRLGLAGLLVGFTDLAAGLPPDMATAMLAILAQALALLLALPPLLTAAIGEITRSALGVLVRRRLRRADGRLALARARCRPPAHRRGGRRRSVALASSARDGRGFRPGLWADRRPNRGRASPAGRGLTHF